MCKMFFAFLGSTEVPVAQSEALRVKIGEDVIRIARVSAGQLDAEKHSETMPSSIGEFFGSQKKWLFSRAIRCGEAQRDDAQQHRRIFGVTEEVVVKGVLTQGPWRCP